MKSQLTTQKKSGPHQTDKRDLVNLDLYNHEIKVMEEQLGEVAEKQPKRKEVTKKIKQIKQLLTIQKEHIIRFRENYELEVDTFVPATTSNENEETTVDENFFEHLKSFENIFKNTRQEVNDFVNKWL